VIHSFHLAELPAMVTASMLVRPPTRSSTPGLRHAECMAMMRFGTPILSPRRLQLGNAAVFAQWDDEAALDRFLADDPLGRRLAEGWHVRLQYLRRFGAIAALGDLPAVAGEWDDDEPIVAVTVARLKMPQVPRFLRWGKPVELLIANHPAAVFSTGAHRPPRTISTFSIWRSVREMNEMVHGHSDVPSAEVHKVAMAEQRRRDFHHESAFMRFRPLAEHGTWKGARLVQIREGRVAAAAMTDNNINDSDITNDGPTEDDENLDAPGEHSKDTGDEPTEGDENLDAPGEHSKDTGDEA
jgi:hypothetical protein